jgi:uncharacterized protein YjbK
MSQELEIEYKNLLTEKEYNTLLTHFQLDEDDFFTQENSYFDTTDYQLKEQGAALRIRIKENMAEITLKTPQDGHLLETNQSISINTAKRFIEEKSFIPTGLIAQTLHSLGIDSSTPIVLMAHLKTKRAEKVAGDELIVLDQSWYGEKMDYELEIEAKEATKGERAFSDLLKQFDIPKRKTKNKIQRAYEALQEGK